MVYIWTKISIFWPFLSEHIVYARDE